MGSWGDRAAVRRAFGSRALPLIVTLCALASILGTKQALEEHGQRRAEEEGRRAAEAVATVLVAPHLADVSLESEPLPGPVAADLREDLGRARAQGVLRSLVVRGLDGTVLFTDVDRDGSRPGGPATRQLAEVRRGDADSQEWQRQDGLSELAVLVPIRQAAGGEPVAVAHTVISHQTASAAAQDLAVRQHGVVSVVILVLAGGVIALRRRWLADQRAAHTDAVTGLPNRAGLLDGGRWMVEAASDEEPLGLLLLDLDDFKSINDTLGHAVGDLLLQQVAEVVRAAVRIDDLVAHLGGDAFVALIPGMAGPLAARERADQLRSTLSRSRFVVDGIEVAVDATIGVALAPQDGTGIAVLVQRAEVAMYQAKRRGCGVRVYDSAADDHTVEHLTMLADLRRALDEGEFVLHYQPKIGLPNGEVTSVEALVRWQHPVRGLLPPGEFLPAVEHGGLIQPLTRWVLRAAVQQAARWRDEGMPLQVAVNISPQNLVDADLPARVLATLLAAELPASLLQLEITETAVMSDPVRAVKTLRQLHARGVELVIDDFGAGYTSLAHLRRLPVSGIKIDRTLVVGLLLQPEDEAVTHALIDLGHRLGLHVVAEGVEDQQTLDRLAALGCDQAQGYTISRPLSPGALEDWMESRRVLRGEGPASEATAVLPAAGAVPSATA